MRKLAFTILILCSVASQAQEIKLGITGGFSPFKRIVLDMPEYAPSNSYYTYLEGQSGEGILKANKIFSSVNVGAVINFSIRRWGVFLEPQYGYERSVYTFKEPLEVKRIIGAKSFRMPLFFTYKFFKKESSAYFLIGWNFIKQTNWDFQNPGERFYFGEGEPYQEIPDFGDDHFKGAMYDDKGYANVIIGLGKQFENFRSSIRFQAPARKFNERLPVQMFRVEMTFSWMFLSTKDFTNKHPLYVE